MVPDSSSLISYLLMIMLASYAVLLDLTPLAVGKYSHAKTSKVRGAINVLSLDFPSIAG